MANDDWINGMNDYGMVFDEDILRELAPRFTDDEDEYEDDSELLYMVAENLGLEIIEDFTGEASLIDDNGEDEKWHDLIKFDCECVYYVPLSHYSNLFRASYRGMEDVISEVKEQMHNDLPDDFDYRSRIRHIMGSYSAFIIHQSPEV